MKLVLFFALMLGSVSLSAQEVQLDSLGRKYFEMDGYRMREYYVCFYKSGSKRGQDQETAATIQKAHLAYLDSLYAEELISMVGPFGGELEGMQGMVIYKTPSIEKARSYANSDPAVKAGRLVADMITWWAAEGGTLD